MDPIAVLKSDAPFADKANACILLSISGDVSALPLLEPMLTEEKLSHMARYALEPMPGNEADAILRRALKTTSGKLKAGVVTSLGVRRDVTAVPEMIPLLADEDGFVAEAAARTLGRIGTLDGIEALEARLVQPGLSYAVMQSLGDGLFAAAEGAQADGNAAQAAQIYDAVYAVEALPVPVRAAALRGAVLARKPKEGLPILLSAIQGDQPVFFAAAMRIAHEIGGKGNTSAALAEVLPSLTPDQKIQLIQVLAERGQDSAGPALLREADSGTVDVQIAALRAATRLAYPPAVPVIASQVLSGDAALAQAAKECLSYFPGKAGDMALQNMLRSNDAKVRCTAVELIGQGGLEAPVDLLMKVAKDDDDESVRVAALEGVQQYAGMEQMPGLLDHLLHGASKEEMRAAEEGLKLLCVRQKAAPVGDIVITRAVYGDLPDGVQADVTEKVQQIIAGGALSVDASNGNFGDTAPGKVKQLRVDYTDAGTPASQTVREGQTLHITSATVPSEIIDALCGALAEGEGETKLAVLRVLTSAGSQQAFEAVMALTSGSDAGLKEAAVRAVCDWPTVLALPTVMDWAVNSSDDTVRVLALRGAVRLLKLGQDAPEALTQNYATLMQKAASADEKKLLLSGLAQVGHASALELVLAQVGDDAVKAEAVQAAISIAKKLGAAPADAAVIERAKALIPELKAGDGK